jgi:hypothetical protein
MKEDKKLTYQSSCQHRFRKDFSFDTSPYVKYAPNHRGPRALPSLRLRRASRARYARLPVFLRFNPRSKLYLRLREYRQSTTRTRSPSAHPYPARSFTPRADSAPLSVLRLLLEPSLLCHAIAIHLNEIRISATSLTGLTGGIPPPYHATRPVPDVGEHMMVRSRQAAGHKQEQTGRKN